MNHRIPFSALALACSMSLLGAAALAQGSAAYPTRILCRTCVAADPAHGKGLTWRPVIGQPIDSFEPWIAHVAGGKPIIIQTPRVNLVIALEGGKIDGLTQSELYYLKTVSKTLASAPPATPPTTLDAHELAHLVAIRVLKLEHELVDLLDLDGAGRVKPEPGPDRPVASDSVDVFLFSAKAGYDAF